MICLPFVAHGWKVSTQPCHSISSTFFQVAGDMSPQGQASASLVSGEVRLN